MTEERVTPLRQRMIEDMRIRGMGDKAQKSHIRAIKDFTAFLGRSPDRATPEDLRGYQLHMTDTGVTPSTSNTRIVALRFFFGMGLSSNLLQAELFARAFHPDRADLDAPGSETTDKQAHQGLQACLLIQSGLCRGLDMRGVNKHCEGVADGASSRVKVHRAEFPARDAVGEDQAEEPGHTACIVRNEVRAFLHDAPIQRVHLGIVGEFGALAAVERQDKGRQPLGSRSIRLDEGFGQRGFLSHGCGGECIEDFGLGPEVPVNR